MQEVWRDLLEALELNQMLSHVEAGSGASMLENLSLVAAAKITVVDNGSAQFLNQCITIHFNSSNVRTNPSAARYSVVRNSHTSSAIHRGSTSV